MPITQFMIIYIPILFIIFYITYIKGNLTIRKIRAFVYICGDKKSKASASVTSCSGYTKRIYYFSESREYRFDFISTIEDGSVELQFLTSEKELVKSFDTSINSAISININMNKNEKYYIITNFHKASGVFELAWK